MEYPGGINFICWTVQDNVRSRDIFRNTIIIHIYLLFLTCANHTFACTEIQGMLYTGLPTKDETVKTTQNSKNMKI